VGTSVFYFLDSRVISPALSRVCVLGVTKMTSLLFQHLVLVVLLTQMVAVDDGLDAGVDDVRERHLVGKRISPGAQRIEAQHGIAFVVVATFPSDQDHRTTVLDRTEMHATKVLDLSDGAATDFLRKLDNIAVGGDDEDVTVTDDGAGKAAGEGEVSEVGGLTDAGVEALDGRGVTVVALGSAEDVDLLAENGRGYHLHGDWQVSGQ